MGTAGGAIILSVLALVVSIVFPLYLESRRERREDRKRVEASWRRITEASARFRAELKTSNELDTIALERWVDSVFLEIGNPDGVLWQNDDAFSVIKDLQALISEFNARKRATDPGDIEREDALEDEHLALGEAAQVSLKLIYGAAEQRMFPQPPDARRRLRRRQKSDS